MMLPIVVPRTKFFDESTNRFITVKEQKLTLEHSLVSISKWESKWEKAFLKRGPETAEETLDYIRCMTITQNVAPITYYAITEENINEILEYIDKPMTASHVLMPESKSNEVVTSELIYYWMISFGIPFECQKWHLNRLLSLIKVCNAKSGGNNFSKDEILKMNHKLNEQRKRKYHTRG